MLPKPRFRLYTTLRSYLPFLADTILGRLRKGDDVEVLEKRMSERLGVRHCVATPMARVAIYLALKHGVPDGKSVIMSPYTIADVVNMVIAAGNRPLFSDIDRSTCNLDPDLVPPLIDDQVGAVLVTHLHGCATPMKTLVELCKQKGVLLVEDAAQAFGANDEGIPCGAIGDVGIFSIGMYKNINAWFGGLLATNNDEIAAKARAERDQWEWQSARRLFSKMKSGSITDCATSPGLFQLFTYWVIRFGILRDIPAIRRFVQTELDLRRHDELPSHYRARLTPAQARLALRQLDRVDELSDIRIAYARLYDEGLKGIDDLLLPPQKGNRQHIYNYYPIQYEDRESLIRWLIEHKRDVGPQHLKNCADLEAFAEFHRDCPAARATANETILLPNYPRYGEKQVMRNIEVIKKFFSNR